MSKGEKRGRRLAKSFGATEDRHGRIQPPTGEDRWLYMVVMLTLTIVSIAAMVLAPKGCEHEEKKARSHGR